jgi:hypothetical protein
MARPVKEIDPEKVRLLASAFCTNEEIAAKLEVSADTLTRRYADALKEGRDTAKGSLRVLQFQAAKRGSVPMLIWLGKQYLGQSDRHDFSFASDDELVAEATGFIAGAAQAETD